MDQTLALHIPSYDELWYRQKIMQDPDTMSYNRGYDLHLDGYDKKTGCIAFPKQEWADWYAYFIGKEPQRFYAYIARTADRTFIGEVNLHKPLNAAWHEMGIVLEAKYRGKGYAAEAMRLLLSYAFETLHANAVHNHFEAARTAAVRTHLSAGFTKCPAEQDTFEWLLSREQYYKQLAPCLIRR